MSVHAKCEKNLQCWRKIYMSINEISIFGMIFFIFRYHWHNNFTSAIKSLNHSFFGFCDADVSFLRQWLQFYVFSFIFSGPDIFFLCQWLKFFDFCLVQTYFFMSVAYILWFLPSADIIFLCQWSQFTLLT